jgi:hypothetical protein
MRILSDYSLYKLEKFFKFSSNYVFVGQVVVCAANSLTQK